MPPYSYLPLRYDSIRVIEVYPGRSEDPFVHCNIIRRRLSDPMLRYEAISYTWGDSPDRVTLSCGGNNAELLVTRNCYDALRSLRQSDKARTIWIDAICINQDDISERSAQVRIMDRIYAAAFQVVAYLGEETPGSRLLFDELAIADSLYQSTQSFEGRPFPNAELVHELDELFHRPWFSRIWVIQEVYVAQKVRLMCGSSYASMPAVFDCAFGYRNTLVTTSLLPTPIFTAMNKWDSMTGDTAQTLWELLATIRTCGATNPRDKIFALKALIADQKILDQFINYEWSVEKVFHDITMLLLPRVKLWLLLAVLHPHTLEMPSWMPDWSGNSNPHTKWYLGNVPQDDSEEEYTIYYLKGPYKEFNNQHPVLCVQGIQHSRISNIGAPFDFEGAEELCYQTLQHIVPELEIPSWLPRLGHACGNSCGNILPPPIFDALQHLNREKRVFILSRGDCSIPLRSSDIREIKRALQNCRIFLTEDGTIGLAPEETCEDDILCILRGSISPLILRQRREIGWTLVSGDCYVTGDLWRLDDEDFFSSYVVQYGGTEEEFLIW